MSFKIAKATSRLVVFRAIDSADHFTPKTGLSPVITISLNGGTFGNPNAGATTATEVATASCFYKFTLDTTDTGTEGPLAWKAAVSGMDPVGDVLEVVKATNFGMTALPDAVPQAAGGLVTSTAGSFDLDGLDVEVDAIKTKTDFLPSVTAGNAGGVFIAGTNAATTVTTSFTTTFTGNLTGSVASVTGLTAADVGAIKTTIGVAGAGLTAITGVQLGATQSAYAPAKAGDTMAMTSNIKKNQALAGFTFLMTDSTNHAPATGLTISVTRSIDAGAYAAGTLANAAELSDGTYSVDFGAGDLNGKVVVLKVTAVGADTTFERIVTQP